MAIVIDGNNTPTAGGIGYGDGTELAFTAAWTSGRPVVSGGAGAPTFRPYTLPAADGSANQVLQTNGSGALSFTTPSGGFTTQDVLTSGTTWAVPAGKTVAKVYVTGGGGAGSGTGAARGGGGGGGTAIRYYNVSAGGTATIAIGAGGLAGASSPGGSGGATTFDYGGVAIQGDGGAGGNFNPGGGTGGASSGTGALLVTGQGGIAGDGGTGNGGGGSSFWGGGGINNAAGTNYGGGGGSSNNGFQGVIVIEY